ERRHLAVLLDAALADADDFALLRLFLGRVRDDDAADFLLALFESLDEDSIVKWSEVRHTVLSLRSPTPRPRLRATMGERLNAGSSWQSGALTVSTRRDRLLSVVGEKNSSQTHVIGNR